MQATGCARWVKDWFSNHSGAENPVAILSIEGANLDGSPIRINGFNHVARDHEIIVNHAVPGLDLHATTFDCAGCMLFNKISEAIRHKIAVAIYGVIIDQLYGIRRELQFWISDRIDRPS